MRNYEALSSEVNLLGVIKAREVIDRYLNRTNLTYYSELSRLVGCEVFVKHENHNPTGSFKIRGAINFFQHMTGEELESGVLVATRGNHGLAMACAGRWFDVPCTVVVPEGNNPEINRIVESFGADLIVHGQDFYDAQSYCDELVDTAGYYYVEQGNEPEILNGLGTMGLEIFEDLPDVDAIICPIGGGAGCASLIKVAQAVNPAGGDHRRAGRAGGGLLHLLEEGRMGGHRHRRHHRRRAGGPQRVPAPLRHHEGPHQPTWCCSAKRRSSTESGWPWRSRTIWPRERGRRRLPPPLKIKDRLAGKKVALVMSGGNLDHEHLLQALAAM